MTDSEMTLQEALALHRRQNDLPETPDATAHWTCKVGPVVLRLPNFSWRRKAITRHDLHHIITGIPCTMMGECEMAAWEFGAGRYPHFAATAFCSPLILLGSVCRPRRIWVAFKDGKQYHSLYCYDDLAPFLCASVSDAKAMLRRN